MDPGNLLQLHWLVPVCGAAAAVPAVSGQHPL